MKDKYLTLEDINNYEDTSALGDDSSNALLYSEPTKKKTREEKLDLMTDPYREDVSDSESEILSSDEYNNLINKLNTSSSTGVVDPANQSNWSKALSSFNRTALGEIVGGTTEGVGALIDIAAKATGVNYLVNKIMGTEDVAYENLLTKQGKNLREWVNEVNPIYRENPNESFDFGDFGYWAEHFPSTFSSISSAVTGAGLAKGTTAIARNLANVGRTANASRLAKLTGTAGKVLMSKPAQVGITAVGNRAVENYREASQSYDSTYQLAMDNFGAMTDEDFKSYLNNNQGVVNEAKEFFDKEDVSKDDLSKYIATRSADKSFVLNTGNLLWDVIQFTAIGKLADRTIDAVRPLSSAVIKAQGKAIGLGSKAIRNRVIKGKAKEALLWGMATLPEAPEEILNYVSGEEATRYAEQLLKGESDEATLLPVIPKEVLSKYAYSPELWESGFWGLVGAGVFGGATKATIKSGNAINKYREAKGKKAWFNVVDGDREQQMQIDEIESREQDIINYRTRMDLINKGFNPDEILLDSSGKPLLDSENNVQYETLDDDKIDKYKSDTTKAYIRDIAKKAARAGTIDYLKEYIDSKDFDASGMYNNLYFDLLKSDRINESNTPLLDIILESGSYRSEASIAMGANDESMIKALIKTELSNIQRLYKQQYNNLLFDDVIPSYINDIVIDNNLDNIFRSNDLDDEIRLYDKALERALDPNDNDYNKGFADANGRELVNDFVTAVEYNLLEDLNNKVATATGSDLDLINKQIETIKKSLTDKGLSPDQNLNPITNKSYNLDNIGDELDNYGLDNDRLVDYAVNKITKSILDNNIITDKEGAVKVADNIVKSMNAANTLFVESAKEFIENEINSAKDDTELNNIVNNLINKNYTDDVNDLLSRFEANDKKGYTNYIEAIKSIVSNKLSAAAVAASSNPVITPTPTVTPTTTVNPTTQSFNNATNTQSLTNAVNELLNTNLTITEDNATNYNYAISKAFKDLNELVTSITVIIDDYGSVEVNTFNNNIPIDSKVDNEAIDYLNALLNNGNIIATPILDENILASDIEDIITSGNTLNKIDNFIQESLKARGIKLNKTYTPINLLDLIFHATDVTNDISKALLIKDQIVDGFLRFKELQSKYRITDQDIQFAENAKLAGILREGRNVYLRSELNKQLDLNNQLVFDLNNSIIDTMFDPSNRLQNGRYTLSATEAKIYEAIQALQPYSKVKDKASKVVVRKDETGNTKVYIEYENQLLPIGEIPYVKTTKEGIVNSTVKNLNYKIENGNVEIISNLINDINDISVREFLDLYSALLEYKKATKDKDGNKLIDPSYLDIINNSIVVNNFLSNMVSSKDRDISLQHLAEIFTFKNITVATDQDDDIRYITTSLLESWKDKVVRNNSIYKSFNELDKEGSIELQVDFINKGFANNSGTNDRNEITYNGIRRSFSKEELDNINLGMVFIENEKPVLRYRGYQKHREDNLIGSSEGGTFLMYEDPNGKIMRINTVNAPINKSFDKNGRIQNDTISKKGNELRDILNEDIRRFSKDLVNFTLTGDKNNIDEVIKYLDKLIGEARFNEQGKYIRSLHGLISGNGIGWHRTNTGLTIFRNENVNGRYVRQYINFNYDPSSDKYNIVYTNKEGKNVYLNNKDKDIETANKLLNKLFYLDDSTTNYLQFNIDRTYITNDRDSFEFTRYKKDNIKFDSYRDYVLSNDILLTTVAGVTNKTGNKVISGFVPSANSVQSGNYVGSPLTIRLRYESNSNKVTTPVEESVNPTEPIVETVTTKLNIILSNNPTLSNIITSLDSNSPYNSISNLFDKLGVNIHPEVLEVGNGVPDVYAYFNKDNKTIYLTNKLDSYNNTEVIRTIVHELMHAAILENNYDTNNLQDIYNEALKSDNTNVKYYMSRLEAMSSDRRLEEFLVEAITSKSFAKGLSTITSILDSSTGEVKSTNLLQKALDILRDIIKSINPSLLSDINVVIDDMYNKLELLEKSETIVDESKGRELVETDINDVIDFTDDSNLLDTDISLDLLDDDIDSLFSSIPEIKQIPDMNTYRESIPDKLKSEYDTQINSGNITYICS